MEANQHNKSWDEQRFIVSGFISFSTLHGALLDAKRLEELIRQVDKDHPWVSYWRDGRPAPSIGVLSSAKLEEPTPHTDRCYVIEIRPSFWLGANQFYAYNRYLCCLAQALAVMAIEGVGTVQAYMTIAGGGASYMSPAGLASLKATMQQPSFQQLKSLFA